MTRAASDSHRAALLTRHASGASTPLQPLAGPQSGLAIRLLAAKRSPATISISIASRVEAARSRKRRGGLPSSGQRTLGTVAINGSRPGGATISRDDARESICIAWFRASHPDGAAVHSTAGNPTGATGTHATADCPPLEPTGPIDEGDDGLTSGCPANTARFRRLDAASAPRGPSEQARHPPLAAQPRPCTISISIATRAEAARSRKKRGGLLSSRQRTRGTIAISGSRPRDYPRRRASSRVHCIGWFHLRIIRTFGYRPRRTVQLARLR